LLLHGFSDDGSCWVSTAGLFFDHDRRVIAPDARAHGRTPLLADDEFTAAGRLADVIELATAMSLKDALVVGHSMGAITAMQLAAARPDLVSAAILVDPRLTGPEFDVERDGQNLFEASLTQASSMDPGALSEICRKESTAWTDDEVTAWVSSKRALDRGLFGRRQSWHGGPWRPTIQSIEIPTIVIAGEVALGSAVDAEAGRWLERCESIEFVRIAGAGHSVHRDQRDRFADSVRGFLSRSG
jgi:pimeloyl-ACP methyl ester carboxylesterase